MLLFAEQSGTRPQQMLVADPAQQADPVEEFQDLDRDLAAVVQLVAEQGGIDLALRRSRGQPAQDADHFGNGSAQEEMIMRHLVESGRIYHSDDGTWVSDVRRVEDLGIPEGIRDAVGRRMAFLSAECNGLLRIASSR